jgi:predicted transcriptional regulator
MTATSGRLRAMMREYHLTRRATAELLGISIETVHHWLAPESNHKYRVMPARMLRLLELELRAQGIANPAAKAETEK